MKNTTKFFHILSYLQYPIMLIALYYSFRPYLNGFETVIDDLNKVLMFMGLGISFSTLQDTSKTQNKISLKVYQNPTYARLFFLFISAVIILLITVGLLGLFELSEPVFQEISLGTLVMGIGMIGLLKAVSEMIENHGKKV